MAKGVNKVILVGNLGQDPELRHTTSGTAVCNIRLATTGSRKDANGEWVEQTEWHSLVAWSRLAEICNEFLHKGSKAYFEGSLQTREYEAKDGQKKWSTEIKVNEMVILSERQASGDGSPTASLATPQTRVFPPGSTAVSAQTDAFQGDDSLPF